jgi:hypothetical protein
VFVGHYSASLVGKALDPSVPLWVLLLAAQLVDVAWVVLVLLGIERLTLDPTLASNPLVLEHMPYTHSLAGTVVWAALAAALVVRTPVLGGTVRGAAIAAAVVLSHWVLDLLVHRPDLTLLGPEPRLGLGLWDHPLAAFVLEIGVLAGAAAFYARRRTLGPAARRALAVGVGALAFLQAVTVLGPAPDSVTALVLTTFTIFIAVAYGAARAERRLRRVRT